MAMSASGRRLRSLVRFSSSVGLVTRTSSPPGHPIFRAPVADQTVGMSAAARRASGRRREVGNGGVDERLESDGRRARWSGGSKAVAGDGERLAVGIQGDPERGDAGSLLWPGGA